ncbi:MAG TPA: penicillin-binding transpeptidase domain-containing protein, partial [Alphaproteobacteria bacterium]|jgi:cell division protein FtsI (penicillin-binding protein 3)
LVVSNGTATAANVPGFQVGGKTGTAEKTGGRGYDDNRRLSSFIGIFPMDAPRYAVMVMVDEPKGTKASYGYATGGWVAAPAVGKIITAMAPVLGFLPKEVAPENDMAAPLLPYVMNKEGTAHLASVGTD